VQVKNFGQAEFPPLSKTRVENSNGIRVLRVAGEASVRYTRERRPPTARSRLDNRAILAHAMINMAVRD
jgi:hypothetical protein